MALLVLNGFLGVQTTPSSPRVQTTPPSPPVKTVAPDPRAQRLADLYKRLESIAWSVSIERETWKRLLRDGQENDLFQDEKNWTANKMHETAQRIAELLNEARAIESEIARLEPAQQPAPAPQVAARDEVSLAPGSSIASTPTPAPAPPPRTGARSRAVPPRGPG